MALDEYIELSEDEMRHQLCDTYFNCLEEILIKYKERFQNLDPIAFIPLLRERMLQIKIRNLQIIIISLNHFPMQNVSKK